MFNKRAWIPAIAVLMLLGAIQTWATVAQDFTTQKAEEEGGWLWLRQQDAFATWEFAALDKAPGKAAACELRIQALVTEGGGAGHDKHMTLMLTSGDFSYKFPVLLNNRNRTTMEASGEKGWMVETVLKPSSMTRGSDKVAMKRLCRTYAETGALRVVYSWRPTREACCKHSPDHPHQVAVKADSMQVFYR